ncbi:MAG: GAF domain-containing protein [Solirubrobacteraceae bacterium]|nr:GAF domain-containing protein [Patulibacter sp.]
MIAITDPKAYTQATHRTRAALLDGRRPEVAPRPVIGASWNRMRAFGVQPGQRPSVDPLGEADLVARRATSGLGPLLPLLRANLLPACEAVGQIMVVADPTGRVLWREGRAAMRRHADDLGFVDGSAWTESNVGTNAIGTAIVTREPVHIHAAEHYAEDHTRWTCAASPLLDPVTHKMLGVVDVSGPAHTVHAGTVSLVALAARLVEAELRASHQERLSELRAIAAPLLARVGGRALVVTPDGATAAVTGLLAPEEIALPDELGGGGEVWLPALGRASAEPLPGGWLLRLIDPADDAAAVTRIALDLTGPAPRLTLWSGGGSWSHEPSPRHTELLVALLRSPIGRTAAQLAADLFGDPTRTVTVRAEISRLRKVLGPVLGHRPYAIAPGIDHALALPEQSAMVLPGSSAPVIAALRTSGSSA